MPESPAPPPEAVLIRRAREAAGLNASQAAAATGGVVTPQWWRTVERGSGTSRSQVILQRGSARTIAHMAAAIQGITPADLAACGREDAAAVLEDIQHQRADPGMAELRRQVAEVKAVVARLAALVGEQDTEAENDLRQAGLPPS